MSDAQAPCSCFFSKTQIFSFPQKLTFCVTSLKNHHVENIHVDHTNHFVFCCNKTHLDMDTLPENTCWGKVTFWDYREHELIHRMYILKSSPLLGSSHRGIYFCKMGICEMLTHAYFLERAMFPMFGVFFKNKWLRRPNHYAHDICIEILSKTLVSISKYLLPRPQNHMKNSKYSSLDRMSTLSHRGLPGLTVRTSVRNSGTVGLRCRRFGPLWLR